jgi:DNA-binding MarR family transcriptional regulator
VTKRPSRFDFSEYLPYLINRVGLALVVDFTQTALVGPGLSIAMWRVLAVLSDDGGQRQIDLAAKTSIDVSTLSRVVTRLVKMGLVTRTRSATNSREVVVRLTPKGVVVVTEAIPKAIAAERTAIAGVPAKDLAVVRRSLRRIPVSVGCRAPLTPSPPPELRAVSAKIDQKPREFCADAATTSGAVQFATAFGHAEDAKHPRRVSRSERAQCHPLIASSNTRRALCHAR